jgi:uncharacterized protein DUF6599
MVRKGIVLALAVCAAFPVKSQQSKSAMPQANKSQAGKPQLLPAILPAEFNGWRLQAPTVKTGSDPAAADPTDYAILKEYGFSDFATGTYQRDGRTIQVKAARFVDATGAYGAFTYLLQPQMAPETIGDRAASVGSRILFFKSNVLVDAQVERMTSMTGADLRALADALPRAKGNMSTLPTLPGHLPRAAIANTERYVLGPVAMERLGIPIPASLVNFQMEPEVEFAKYHNHLGGEAKFTLISYPTNQIAAERLRTMQAANIPGGPYYFKRTGPLLAVVNGGIDESEARDLLSEVVYDAEVTWNQAAKRDERDNIGNLIIGVFMLIGVLLIFSLVFGLLFGGVRVVAKKFFPDRFFDRPEDVDIIRLDLK